MIPHAMMGSTGQKPHTTIEALGGLDLLHRAIADVLIERGEIIVTNGIEDETTAINKLDRINE